MSSPDASQATTPFFADVQEIKGGTLDTQCIPRAVRDEKLASIKVLAATRIDGLPDWAKDATKATCDQFEMTDDPRCHLVYGTTEVAVRESTMVIRESLPFTRWGLCLGVGIFLSGIFAAVFGRERLGRLATVSLELCVTLFAGIMLAIIVSGYSYVLMRDPCCSHRGSPRAP